MLAVSSHVRFHYSGNTQVLSSDLQTDAIDNHRSFHDKHGFTGKRELEPEDEARPGERTLISGHTGQWGGIGLLPPLTHSQGLSLARSHLSATRNRSSKPEGKLRGGHRGSGPPLR